MQTLYHGSTKQGLATLEPRQRFTPAGAVEFAAIYASPNPAFAACHAFPWSSDEGIDIEIENDLVTLVVPKALESKLNVQVSIYEISDEHFSLSKEEETGLTWYTTESVPVLKETQFTSVGEALEKYEGSIRIV